METNTIDTAQLTLTRRYAASPSAVFDAFTTEDALQRWFAPNDEMTVVVTDLDVSVGGRYRIEMRHQGGNVHTVGGTFNEIDKPNRLVFTWKWEGGEMGAMPDTRVAVDFAAIDGGTEVHLIHDGFPNEEAKSAHEMGWHGCMWRLDRVFGASTLHHDSLALAVNRKLFTNALDGIADDDLAKRTSKQTNHLLWVAGHIAHTRAALAQLMGADFESPLKEFNDPIDDSRTYADLETVKDVFAQATNALHTSLPLVSDEALAGPAPWQLPVSDQTLGGAIAFLVQHEAYHVGQMGLLRKALGYDATSYA